MEYLSPYTVAKMGNTGETCEGKKGNKQGLGGEESWWGETNDQKNCQALKKTQYKEEDKGKDSSDQNCNKTCSIQ